MRVGHLVVGLAGACGSLYAAEARAGSEPARFARMDTDHDGRLSPDEHAAAAKKMFATMDADSDGQVTAAEMANAHRQVTGMKARKGNLSAAQKIKMVDGDGDGVLTADEHAAAARTVFVQMDTDQDGLLTVDEVKAGHARMKSRTPKGRRSTDQPSK